MDLSFIINDFDLILSLSKYEITIPSKKREKGYNKIQHQNNKNSHEHAVLDLNFLPIDHSKITIYGILSRDLDESIKSIKGVPKKFSSKIIINKISQIYEIDVNNFAPPLYRRRKKKIEKECLLDLIEDDGMMFEDPIMKKIDHLNEEEEIIVRKKTRRTIPKVLSISFLPFYFHELSTKLFGQNINTISLFYELLFYYQNTYLTEIDNNLSNSIKLQFQIMHHNIVFLTNIYKECTIKYIKLDIKKQNQKRKLEISLIDDKNNEEKAELKEEEEEKEKKPVLKKRKIK